MRIAHLTGTFSGYSGIDRVVAMLAAEQQKAGHQVLILTLAGDMTPPIGVELQKLRLPKSLLLQRIYRLLFFFDRNALRTSSTILESFDVVFSHQYPMNSIALEAKRRYGVKYVYYDHGIPPNNVFGSFIDRFYIGIFRFFANRTIRQADAAISISHYLQKVLEEQTGIKSEVIYDHADGTRFHQHLDGQVIRKKYQLTHEPIIFYVGRISPHKAVHELITAFLAVRKAIPGAHLIIAGKPTFPSYQRYLEKIADEHVHFVGFVSDDELPLYYAAANIYATATHWEGFDLPIAEAQAVGRPVVAYDVGPHKEIIDASGVLVPIGDVQAFAQGIEKVLARSV